MIHEGKVELYTPAKSSCRTQSAQSLVEARKQCPSQTAWRTYPVGETETLCGDGHMFQLPLALHGHSPPHSNQTPHYIHTELAAMLSLSSKLLLPPSSFPCIVWLSDPSALYSDITTSRKLSLSPMPGSGPYVSTYWLLTHV